MTGRQWRYGAAMMPHLVAGAAGPKELVPLHADVAPTGVLDDCLDARGNQERGDDELDDGHGVEGSVLEAAEEVLSNPVVPDASNSEQFKRLWGSMQLHEAVLDTFCRMAVLSGRLMGDNVANTTTLSESEINNLDKEARCFIVDYLDVLFGPANTTKAHRAANHLRSHLFNHGNLWCGDTSENEGLHRVCKRMFSRSNKRGPTLVLQMMRACETQVEVLRELEDVEEQVGDAVGLGGDLIDSLLESDVDDGGRAAAGRMGGQDFNLMPVKVIPRSRRGNRQMVAELAAQPGLGNLAAALGVSGDSLLVVAQSISFFCKFEWGSPSVVQTAWATASFEGRPRYDHLRFLDSGGMVQFGAIRLVVRVVDGEGEDFVLVHLLQRAAALPRCSLSRTGCERLRWSFVRPDDAWPALVKVPLVNFLRLEHVVPDFRDLAERMGLRSRPSTVPDTPEERHAQRFFTNAYFPWTSREQHPR